MSFINNSDEDWERFGKTDPYFAVLTEREFHGTLGQAEREKFFRSGQAHIDAVFSIIRERLDPSFAPSRALDFGCGVGRIVIPLAGKCRDVTGTDVSPSMLAEARRNCDQAGATNVQLLASDDTLALVDGPFDFVHSYIVFQHIPIARGEHLIRRLASMLASNGVAMFHVTYSSARRTVLERMIYWARLRVPAAQWVLNLARGRSIHAPLMQMNNYSLTRLLDILCAEGCTEVHLRFSDHGGARGALLFARKSAAPLFT